MTTPRMRYLEAIRRLTMKGVEGATDAVGQGEHKGLSFALVLKDADKGEVQAKIATLGVIDKDGDIIRPGAFAKGSKVAMSSYGHDIVYGGAMPVGKGTLSVDGKDLVFDGRMFLTTPRGRETFDVLKEMGDDQEWSFGFRVTGWEAPSEAEKKAGAYRVITKGEAYEVSPVLVGAGVDTQTLGVKRAAAIAPSADATGDSAASETDTKAGIPGTELASTDIVSITVVPKTADAEEPPLAPPVTLSHDDELEAIRVRLEKARGDIRAAMEDGALKEFERFTKTIQKFRSIA